jgi:hypothetical protein
MTLGRRLAAEGLGTALLLAAIIGSGIMGEQLAGGNTAIALLANTVATGAALVALILTFGPSPGRITIPWYQWLRRSGADWRGVRSRSIRSSRSSADLPAWLPHISCLGTSSSPLHGTYEPACHRSGASS